MAETLNQRIERERKEARPSLTDWSDVRLYREYARGRQRKTLNADQIRIMAGVIKSPFSDNILKKIITEHATRLRLARFDVEDKGVSSFLYDLWIRNQLPDLFADAIYAVLRDGNHAISLNWQPSDSPNDPDGGRVVLNRERWWDGKDGVFVKYDDSGQPEYAVKEWKSSDGVARRNIYFPEAFYRFQFRDGAWEPFILEGDEELFAIDTETGRPVPGLIPWLKLDGSPLGIPIVHLPNGSDDDTYYGASILDGGTLGFQDQINAIQHDITAAAMMNGSVQTWSKGFSLPIDNEGNPVRIKTGPGTHHHTDETTAEWGVIPAGSLTELKNAYMTKVEAVCRNTNTPIHTITGQWPSGEAIFRAEMPIVGDTLKLAESIGPQMSTVAHRATEIYNAFGIGPELNEDSLIRTIFEPAEQRDPITIWTVAEKSAPFVSNQEVLRSVGKTPEEIKMIMDERADEKTESISMAQAAFSRPPDMEALLRAGGQAVDVSNVETEGNE